MGASLNSVCPIAQLAPCQQLVKQQRMTHRLGPLHHEGGWKKFQVLDFSSDQPCCAANTKYPVELPVQMESHSNTPIHFSQSDHTTDQAFLLVYRQAIITESQIKASRRSPYPTWKIKGSVKNPIQEEADSRIFVHRKMVRVGTPGLPIQCLHWNSNNKRVQPCVCIHLTQKGILWE